MPDPPYPIATPSLLPANAKGREADDRPSIEDNEDLPQDSDPDPSETGIDRWTDNGDRDVWELMNRYSPNSR